MTDQEQLLVTIVTPSFNQATFIGETIQSVISQDYQPIEHIVIDGGSTDGTLEILKKYQDRLKWTSESDRGQADAINKGFRRAHGAILGWLNADDLLMPGAISTVANYFQTHPQVALVYGDALAIDERGRLFGRRANVSPCNFDSLLRVGDFIVQPAAFWRTELWQRVGELDESLHYVLDYEYWIRAAQHYDLVYISKPLAKERMYGSAKTFRGGIERVSELEAMPRRFGGEGIPLRFRSEAAAIYLVRGWRYLKQRQWEAARADIRKGLNLSNSFSKTLLYLISTLIFGEARIPGLRLIANRIRGVFQRMR
jgi:glycosyltransferase involved in cell wall biosynthesis